MNIAKLTTLAALIDERNEVSSRITALTGRPAQIGHLGEFIAAEVFDIALEQSATNKGFDGRFRTGPLAGKTVDVKWYPKREGIVDLRLRDLPDFYLVLAGPISPPASSRDEARPWLIEGLYLFDARALVDSVASRGIRVGIATSVASEYWQAAEVFPRSLCPTFELQPDQFAALALFSRSQADERDPSR